MIEGLEIANTAAYFGAAMAVGFGGIGSGFGIGSAGVGATVAMAVQPHERSGLFRGMLISQAVASNPSIFALVIGLVLYNIGGTKLMAPDSLVLAAAYLGAGLSIGLGAIGCGIGNGQTGSEAMTAIGRTPSHASKITIMMLVGQAMGQTPVLFSFVISLILCSKDPHASLHGNFALAAAFLGASLSIGFGAIGSGIGNGMSAAGTMSALARNPEQTPKLSVMMIVGQAMGQTPVLFSLVVSFMMIFSNAEFIKMSMTDQILSSCRYLGAGVCMGLAAIGPGIGSGYTGAALCEGMADRPELSQKLNNVYFVGTGVAQSTAIYGFVVGLLLLTA